MAVTLVVRLPVTEGETCDETEALAVVLMLAVTDTDGVTDADTQDMARRTTLPEVPAVPGAPPAGGDEESEYVRPGQETLTQLEPPPPDAPLSAL